MVGNDLTARILERGLAASSLRHQVTANNIANLMTPGFKASHVDFEEQLGAALANRQDADAVRPAVVVDQATTGRPDGNNVDVEGEMVVLGANQIWYSALTRQLSDHFARLGNVIHDGRR